MKLLERYPWLRRWETLLFVILCAAVFINISLSEHYFNIDNLANIFHLSIEKAFVVLVMALVIINGEIDLSVASVMGLSASVLAYEFEKGASLESAISYAMLAGLACGLANGFFVAYLNIPSLVVTLAGLIAYRGAARILLEDRSVGNFPEWFTSFALDDVYVSIPTLLFVLVGLILIGTLVYQFTNLRQAVEEGAAFRFRKPGPVGLVLITVLAAVLVYMLALSSGAFEATTYVFAVLYLISLGILQFTNFGRYIYVIGNNRAGAEYAGLRVKQVKMTIFVMSALMAAFAGLMYAARVGNIRANAAEGFELDIITIVLLGGVSIFGGTGTMVGVGLSLLVVLNLRNGMSLRNINDNTRASVIGALLILSVLIPNWAQTIQRFLPRTLSGDNLTLDLENKEARESTETA
ncbi:MAG: ABC transporter permease [Chloroflexi bacterium]|nr:ABC transporter permease [Chloroflexota bacterium]